MASDPTSSSLVCHSTVTHLGSRFRKFTLPERLKKKVSYRRRGNGPRTYFAVFRTLVGYQSHHNQSDDWYSSKDSKTDWQNRQLLAWQLQIRSCANAGGCCTRCLNWSIGLSISSERWHRCGRGSWYVLEAINISSWLGAMVLTSLLREGAGVVV